MKPVFKHDQPNEPHKNGNPFDLEQCLNYIDCSSCSYLEWIKIGMALKFEGYHYSTWEEWSRTDTSRYKDGECEKKWQTFDGSHPSGSIIVKKALENGMKISRATIANKTRPEDSLVEYLSALHDDDDIIHIMTYAEYDEIKKKWNPKGKGLFFNVGNLKEQLKHYSIRSVIGNINPDSGVWIRENPMDGFGGSDANVTKFKYALVESDEQSIKAQYTLMTEVLNLPIVAMVHSGGKSLHALVRIDALDEKTYRNRVNMLHFICQKRGLIIDGNNKNPSRLTRLPGVKRGDNHQYLIFTNKNAISWEEWYKRFVFDEDGLPPITNWSDFHNKPIELKPELIEGVLRVGHKMSLNGGSKNGKSWMLIELAIAFSLGLEWLGFQCKKSKVLYLNLEIDSNSFMNRIEKSAQAQNIQETTNINNLSVWNLRGTGINVEELAKLCKEKLINEGYEVIIIDPIYKLGLGNENDAESVGNFFKSIDSICAELGASVIFCHHHSKGSQTNKASIDRSSGSGVFGRDPDAIMDFISLDIPPELRSEMLEDEKRAIYSRYMNNYGSAEWKAKAIDLNSLSLIELDDCCKYNATEGDYDNLQHDLKNEVFANKNITAMQIEFTLREFAPQQPLKAFFKYPLHYIDSYLYLANVKPKEPNKTEAKQNNKNRIPQIYNQYYDGVIGGLSLDQAAELLGVSTRTVRVYIKGMNDFEIENSVIKKKE